MVKSKNKTKKYLGGSGRNSAENYEGGSGNFAENYEGGSGNYAENYEGGAGNFAENYGGGGHAMGPMMGHPMGYQPMMGSMMGHPMDYQPMIGPMGQIMMSPPMMTAAMGYPMGQIMMTPMGPMMMTPIGPMSPPMMSPMGPPMMSPTSGGGTVASGGPSRRKLKKKGISGKLNKTTLKPPSVSFQRTFNNVNARPFQLTNANNVLFAPPSRTLEKIKTVGKNTIYDLLQFPSVRMDFTRIIHDMLLKSGTGIDIIAPLPDYPTINPNYYLNFNVNKIHLSIHYDRSDGGKAGHIHVTNDTEICRILIIYDAKTNEHFIGGCYQNISTELVYISNICVDAIIELLFNHSGLVLTKKEICNS